ncbi:CHAT domain-containing protein [Kriegella aquimaris]|uniref:Anaphase-promoting complex, cyclosome, subunit 3 n=1 Tax=Kriegella aquimaris TaxID=192904 RepID=A0A1G9WDT7_9FLAO|nr:CHAT domain-containing protein [Kriegella aquimaris]SDM82433.1 Anaphase-promoting complex, cyclosome, subunit 3 [Kriegella aquimaris]
MKVFLFLLTTSIHFGLFSIDHSSKDFQENLLITASTEIRTAQTLIQAKKYDEAMTLLGQIRKKIQDSKPQETFTMLTLQAISLENSIYLEQKEYDKGISFLKSSFNTLLQSSYENENFPILIFSQATGMLQGYERAKRYEDVLAIYQFFEEKGTLTGPIKDLYQYQIAALNSSIKKRQEKENRKANTATTEKTSPTRTENSTENKALAATLSLQEAVDSNTFSKEDILRMAEYSQDEDTDADIAKLLALADLKEEMDTKTDFTNNAALLEKLQQVDPDGADEFNGEMNQIAQKITTLLGIEDLNDLDNLSIGDMNLNFEAIQQMAAESDLDISMDSIKYAWNNLKTNDSLLYDKLKRTSQKNLSEMNDSNTTGTSRLMETHNLFGANLRLKEYGLAKKNLDDFASIYQNLPEIERGDYDESIINISYWSLYFAQKKYRQALPYAVNLTENNKGIAHTNSEYTVALTYFQMKEFQNAQKWSEIAITNLKAQGTKNNSTDIQQAKTVRAQSLLALEKYQEAFNSFESLEIQTQINPKREPSLLDLYFSPLSGMALACEKMGQSEKADKYMSQYINTVTDEVFERNMNSLVRPEENEEKYISDNIFYFLSERKKESEEVLGLGYNTALLFKEFQLNSAMTMADNYLDTNDRELKKLFYDYLEVKEKSKDLNSSSRQKDSLADYDRAYEKILKQKNKEQIVKLFDVSDLNFTHVKSQLKVREAALEFVSYSPYAFSENSEAIFYGVFILMQNDTHPEFIPLFQDTDLKSFLEPTDNMGSTLAQTEYIYKTNATQLYQLIWKPLEQHLKNIKTLFYAPTGILHSLCFDALSSSNGSFLSDQYRLIRVGSTKNIAKTRASYQPYNKVALLGGIDYDYNLSSETSTRGGKERSGEFTALAGTAEEINLLNDLVKSQGLTAIINSEQNATEERLYHIIEQERPDILHVATHAFYVKSVEEDMFTASENVGYGIIKENQDPMNRSGLALAGANRFWKSGNKVSNQLEDGIVTANEMANLNLRNVKLVTLSACETALGRSSSNEGVFGLQRGLKMAGAENLLLSLWKVDDMVTKEYMTAFYSYLLQKKLSMQEAYAKTREDIKKAHPEPYFWASFVLIQ